MKRKPLFSQLYPSYLLITVFVLIAVSAYASRAIRTSFLDHTASGLKEQALLMIPRILPHLAPPDPAAVDRICKSLSGSARTRLTVILPSGEVIGDSRENPALMDNHAHRPEVSQALRRRAGTAVRFSRTLEKDMMYVALPMPRSRKLVGIIRTAVNVNAIEGDLNAIQMRFALWGGIVAVLAAGISYIVTRRIARPLEEMRKGAEHFAGGNLGFRLSVPATEEMGALARAMNEMAEQLDDRIRTVLHQRNELDAVLSSMLEGVVAVDMDERIIRINESGARMFGKPRSELTGRAIQEVIRNPKFQRFARQALFGEAPKEGDIVFYHAGEQILHTHFSPLYDLSGARIGILAVFNDVTRLRRLETIRRDFAANVSHELKTPLTAIRGFVETLRGGGLDDPEDADRFLGIIERHVGRLSAIIDDLMQLSKIEQAGTEADITLSPADLGGIIEAALAVCRPAAEEKGIALQFQAEAAVTALVNPPLLEHAVVNLVDNAIKYTDSGRTVTVRLKGSDEGSVIAVHDQGIGISPRHIPRVFERFYRVDRARSRKAGGTGLGLAIVKHIVGSHNGRVTVESSLGQGSTFAIHLPSAPA